MKDKIIKGAKIRISTFDEYPPSEHIIEEVEWGWNDIVPVSIFTCCGVYRPTSSADGYWERDMHLNGWDLV